MRGRGGGWIKHYLCKHGLPVLGDHGALVTVQGDAGVVEGLLGVFEDVVQLGDAALEHRAEVAGDQRPADGCRGTHNKADSLSTRTPKHGADGPIESEKKSRSVCLDISFMHKKN